MHHSHFNRIRRHYTFLNIGVQYDWLDLGYENIGQTVAQHLLKDGFPVVISNSHGPESLKEIVKSLGTGVNAGSVKEAANADMVFLSVPWLQVPSLTGVVDWIH